VTTEIWRRAADGFVAVSLVQHLVLYVIAAMHWARRRSMERLIDWCFASAFATAAAALLATPGAAIPGCFAAALAALWARDALHPANAFSFATVPRLRLVVMGGLALFGAAYPGYAEGLPAILFSPYGVLLHPTIIVSLAALNCADHADRLLRWALVVTGFAWGVAGAVDEGLVAHAPLLAVSAYGAVLALGMGKKRAAPASDDERTLRDVRDRMYARWTLLPGPRNPRGRGRRSGAGRR
jgi:hypothetical protein